MKKFKIVFYLLLVALFLSGCEYKISDKYSNKIVTDKEGNKYKLIHNGGDTYFVVPLEMLVPSEYLKDCD